MAKKITKGMILAAGLGTRLRPITNKTPKPLIEVGGRKIIEYNLALFEKSGVKDIVINLHHLGEQIKAYLGGGSKYGVKITYSYEQPILGTGGGIKKVEGFFGKAPFIVINGDVITDIDLRDVMAFHLERDAEATLVLRPLDEGENYTPVRVDGERLMGFGGGDMMYTGIQIVESPVLKLLPEGVFSDIVAGAYIPMLKGGRKISAYIYSGFWIEAGTLDGLEFVKNTFQDQGVDLWYL